MTQWSLFEVSGIDSATKEQLRPLPFAILFGISLFLAFLAGNVLQYSTGFSVFWAPIGVGTVALLWAPFRWWPAILAAITITDCAAGWYMFGRLAFPDDALKVGVLAFLLRKITGTEPFRINSLQRYVTLLLSSGLCFSAVTYFSAPSREYWTGFWMGDLLGVTMIAPLAFLENAPHKRAMRVESIITLGVLFVAIASLFLPPELASTFAFEFPYLLLPILLWVTIRLPDRIVALTTIGIAAISVYFTGQGLGPFLALPITQEEQLLLLQAYLLVVTTGPVLLSLGLYERKTASSQGREIAESLHESKLNYGRLFGASGVAIALLEGRSIAQRNERFVELFSLEADQGFLGRAPEWQADGRSSAEVAEELYRESRDKAHFSFWSTLKPDGQIAELELTIFPIPHSDLRAVTALDVTESRRLLALLKAEQESLATRVEVRSKELLAANTELRSSVRAKSEMVALLSHELKTPLTALIAQTDTLVEELFGPLTPQQKKAATEMRDKGERLSRLVLDLLDLHRIEANQVKISKREVCLEELIKEVLERLEVTLERRQVRCELQGETQLKIHTDPRILSRILTLLLGRAARQTPPGESFGIRVEAWQELQKLDITVWDSGPPLSQETLSSLSDAYAFRSEADNRSETGVGLAVAASLLKSLEGKLEARVSDKGTWLNLFLPLTRP